MSKNKKKHRKGMSLEEREAKEEIRNMPKEGIIKKAKKKLKSLPATGVIIVLLVVGGLAGWLRYALPADELAKEYLSTKNGVRVELVEDTIVFSPEDQIPKTGFIYYPGGRVEPESFAYGASKIAEKGYMVIIQKMPFNLAMLGKNKADEIVESYPEIENWYLGGFSLGGITAAMKVSEEMEEDSSYKGLVLYASYTTEDYDLSNSDIKVLSISGSEDGLATPKDIEAGKPYLPKETDYVVVEGGNHTGFALYNGEELQKGDNPRGIPKLEQQEEIIQKTVEFLGR